MFIFDISFSDFKNVTIISVLKLNSDFKQFSFIRFKSNYFDLSKLKISSLKSCKERKFKFLIKQKERKLIRLQLDFTSLVDLTNHFVTDKKKDHMHFGPVSHFGPICYFGRRIHCSMDMLLLHFFFLKYKIYQTNKKCYKNDQKSRSFVAQRKQQTGLRFVESRIDKQQIFFFRNLQLDRNLEFKKKGFALKLLINQ